MSDLHQLIADAREEATKLPASDPFAQRVQYALDDAGLYASQLQGFGRGQQQQASPAGTETGEADTSQLGLS